MNTRRLDELLEKIAERRSSVEKLLDENGIEYGAEAQQKTYFSTECSTLKDLKVAAIMDDFTLGNFKTECDLLELECPKWKEQIDSFRPDLLFVESAWNGKDKTWYKKIANGSKELLDLTEYCRSIGVPSVFWNKEDPVYTDVFMSAAACADFVFTTDFDCVERYKRTLRHDNVYYLHFAAQPLVHEPTEIHDRKDKFCFAGAYYHRYRDRCRTFDEFSEVFRASNGIEIFDRNLGSARPEHAFPSQYKNEIVGTLKPDDIHIAYKGYNYNVNMNSVGQSQTMFARRVYELLASDTVCVGNYARGLKNIFGDLTICTDSPDALRMQLQRYCSNENDYRRYRLRGLRKVLEGHLCEDRLAFIASLVFGRDMKKALPKVYVYTPAKTDEEIKKVSESFDAQSYKNSVLVLPGDSAEPGGSDLVGVMLPGDYYGDNYLNDLVHTVRYRAERGFGKACFFTKTQEPSGEEMKLTYRKCGELNSARALFFADSVTVDEAFINGCGVEGDFFCVDEFNYSSGGFNPLACDIFVPDTGISLETITERAESIKADSLSNDVMRITPSEMFAICPGKVKGLKVRLEGARLVVESTVKPGKPKYLVFRRKFLPKEFFATDEISVLLSGSGETDVENHVAFYDASSKLLDTAVSTGLSAVTAKVPQNTSFITLSLRFNGPGTMEYSGVTAGKGADADTVPFLSRSNVAVLADRYPDYDDLYRYMFVHKRVSRYRENGLNADVLCISPRERRRYREFFGVNVTCGDASALDAALENGSLDTVAVHFLNRYLWGVLKNHLDKIRLVVWSHGSDIQPFERRSFNYKTESEIVEAKRQSDERMKLWREVFECAKQYDVRFVFVSDWFRRQVEEDYGVDLSGISSVIHNCVDSSLFTYEEKDESQRYKIMSVKSYSSLVYANDVTQDAITLLSNAPEFDKMEFDLYGDGVRFDEDTAKLKKFKNVRLHRGFMTQEKIAELHKTHGVYLATTRMDTQGVSRDEAMCSGLVPVANAVAAIPEFTDESCCMLCRPESAEDVANAVLELVRNPEKFKKMSRAAAERVRAQSNENNTIKKEIALLTGQPVK